jgi:hypothetical protein
MSPMAERDKLQLAQLLMVEITGRLEDLSFLAANQQRAKTASPDLVDGIATVMDLVTAYGHVLGRRRTSSC